MFLVCINIKQNNNNDATGKRNFSYLQQDNHFRLFAFKISAVVCRLFRKPVNLL